jgi:hypothetical protein
MIKLTKKAIELLDVITSVPYSRKRLGYTMGRGLDAVLPFTCYSNWFSSYFDQRGKLMKALITTVNILHNVSPVARGEHMVPGPFHCVCTECFLFLAIHYFGSGSNGTDMVRTLVNAGCDVNVADNEGWTAIYQSAFGGDSGWFMCFVHHHSFYFLGLGHYS